MRVTIIGAGAFGSALGEVLMNNDHTTVFYDPIKYPNIALETALEGAEVILMVAPSNVVPEMLPKLPHHLPLVLASKWFLSLDLVKEFPNFSVISGGAFASDLMSKHLVTLTGTSKLTYDLFNNNSLTVEVVNDTKGVLICGSLKNVYAIGAGLQNLDRHTDEFNVYAGHVLSELYKILQANGCEESTANKSCGVMDLIITSTPASRNYSFGRELAGTTGKVDTSTLTLEGVTAIRNIANTSDFVKPDDTPILDQIMIGVSGRLA